MACVNKLAALASWDRKWCHVSLLYHLTASDLGTGPSFTRQESVESFKSDLSNWRGIVLLDILSIVVD